MKYLLYLKIILTLLLPIKIYATSKYICSITPKAEADKILEKTKDYLRAARFIREEIAKGCNEFELMLILYELKDAHLSKEYPEVDSKNLNFKTIEKNKAPSFPKPYGFALMNLGKFDKAIPALIIESYYLSMPAQIFLWQIYSWGLKDKIAKYDPRALKFYQELAEEGHPRIKYNLATIYAEGLGIEKNIDKAIELITSSELPEAIIYLGTIYLNELKDYPLAEKTFLSVLKEDPQAAYYLGLTYRYQKKYKQSFKYFSMRNKEAPDEAETIVNLGQLHLEGWGTPMNCELGKKLYHDAAERLNFDFAKKSLEYYYASARYPKFRCFVKNTTSQPTK